MTRDTDLIRRGDAMNLRDELADVIGARPMSTIHSALSEYRKAISTLPAHPVQEPPGPGVTAGATRPVSDADFLRDAGMDGAKWAAGFKAIAERLGHHGMDEGWLIGWFCNAIMAGYDEAERRYQNATPAPVVPADQRAAIEALADRMWRVHPKDIHAAGYEHLERGGKYENPRAAWYADQIEALFKQFRDQVSPVVPAEGLDAHRYALHLATALRERLFPDNTGWRPFDTLLGLLTQIDNMTTAIAPPVGARVRPLVWGPYDNPVFAGPDVAIADVEFSHRYQVQRDPWAATYIAVLHPRLPITSSTLWWESKGHADLEAAKAAAQADYESRILAALLPAGEGEE